MPLARRNHLRNEVQEQLVSRTPLREALIALECDGVIHAGRN
jgi:DNA-binding GntR family transcriptional regulator